MYLHAQVYLVMDNCQVTLTLTPSADAAGRTGATAVWAANGQVPAELEDQDELGILLHALVHAARTALREREG